MHCEHRIKSVDNDISVPTHYPVNTCMVAIFYIFRERAICRSFLCMNIYDGRCRESVDAVTDTFRWHQAKGDYMADCIKFATK